MAMKVLAKHGPSQRSRFKSFKKELNFCCCPASGLFFGIGNCLFVCLLQIFRNLGLLIWWGFWRVLQIRNHRSQQSSWNKWLYYTTTNISKLHTSWFMETYGNLFSFMEEQPMAAAFWVEIVVPFGQVPRLLDSTNFLDFGEQESGWPKRLALHLLFGLMIDIMTPSLTYTMFPNFGALKNPQTPQKSHRNCWVWLETTGILGLYLGASGDWTDPPRCWHNISDCTMLKLDFLLRESTQNNANVHC